jgi:ketose-bisphosphate aldolase
VPLESIPLMLRRALQEGYAVGYFESWNLESLQGVVDAAEQTLSPVILGFNGGFLSGPRQATERISWYAALGRAAAESATVPCGLIFNECPRDDWVRSAIAAGFNLVMLADPEASPEDLTSRIAALTRLAHANGVAIEAEVGELPCAASGAATGGASTDPEAAAAFVEATAVDLLAVSVGNVHIRTEGEQGLDLHRLEAIRGRVSLPLVLHGGTGIAAGALREAIALGVAKVNYGTYLKQDYLKAVRAALGRMSPDPHRLLGLGGPEDVMVAGRLAVRNAVLQRISLLGCSGKAARDVPFHANVTTARG